MSTTSKLSNLWCQNVFPVRRENFSTRFLHSTLFPHRSLDGGEEALSLTTDLLDGKAYQSLVDFDNHLDDITQDWLNKDINKLVD